MATLTPQFFQLLEANQKTVFFNEHDAQETKYTKLFNTVGSTKAYEDRIKVARLGTFVQKPEGTPVAYDDPAQGTQVRTVHQTFALGWRATEEMMEDDQFNVMSQMSRDLGASATDHMERLAWSLVNDGFTGTNYTGLENDVLFSTTHTILKGGATVNQSNVINPAVALSQTGLESIMNMVSTSQSDEGRYINVNPRFLLIHPNLQHLAYVLLNTEFKPGSADNDRNTVITSRSGLEPLVVPYLSSQTNWFVLSGPGDSGNTFQWNNRKSLTFSRQQDSDTFDQKFTARYRASVMWSEWRRNFASQAV
jgi:phage major head subunit gpT-like protein